MTNMPSKQGKSALSSRTKSAKPVVRNDGSMSKQGKSALSSRTKSAKPVVRGR